MQQGLWTSCLTTPGVWHFSLTLSVICHERNCSKKKIHSQLSFSLIYKPFQFLFFYFPSVQLQVFIEKDAKQTGLLELVLQSYENDVANQETDTEEQVSDSQR